MISFKEPFDGGGGCDMAQLRALEERHRPVCVCVCNKDTDGAHRGTQAPDICFNTYVGAFAEPLHTPGKFFNLALHFGMLHSHLLPRIHS